MKVLLSAYFCEPGKGSDEGVGWNMAKEAAKYHEVWVVTRSENRLTIEPELACKPDPNLHFVYFDLPFWTSNWEKGQQGIQFHYYLWQAWAYLVARPLHQKIGFDSIRHVTFIRYWSPSFLALLPVPFIWGPVGGGESAPTTFWNDFSSRGKKYEALRNIVRWLGEHDPFVNLTAQRSALALATTEETAAGLRRLRAKDIQIFACVGLPRDEIDCLARYYVPDSRVVRFISIGRLLHWKGFHLSLRAFAIAKLENIEYWIVGDGPERQELAALSKELGVADTVRLCGKLPRSETLLKLGECHVLVHPSLHDSGGFVCLEAMASGRPVICLDLGGPATQVTEDTGFKIPAHNPEQAVQGLADAMTCLAHDSELRTRLGQAGQKRVNELYDWEIRGKLLAQLHEEVSLKRLMN